MSNSNGVAANIGAVERPAGWATAEPMEIRVASDKQRTISAVKLEFGNMQMVVVEFVVVLELLLLFPLDKRSEACEDLKTK